MSGEDRILLTRAALALEGFQKAMLFEKNKTVAGWGEQSDQLLTQLLVHF